MVQMYRREGKNLDVVVLPLHDQLYGSAGLSLWLLLGAAALLLLITCANVTNLSLARALDRRREFAMRVSLGATRASVGSLLVIENLLLALAGAAGGLVLAWLGTDYLVTLAPPSIVIGEDIRVRGTQIVFAASLAVIACLIVSAAPVIDTTRISIGLGQIGARTGRGRGTRRLRQTLVVVQLALTLLLVTGAGLLIRSVAQLTRSDHLGFSAEGVVVLNVEAIGDRYQDRAARQTFSRDLMLRLRAIPGVQLVSSGPAPLVSGAGDEGYREGFNTLTSWGPPGHEEQGRMIWVKNVDPEYRSVYAIPLMRGRWFNATDDSTAARVAMINNEAAHFMFGDVDPIGRQLPMQKFLGAPPPVVVGVVSDVLQRDLALTANPEIYLPVAQQPAITFAMLSVKSAMPTKTLIAAIQRQLRATSPDLAASRLESMTDVVAASLARHTFVLRLLGLFAALGLALSVIGLYATVSYLVTQRTSEIGVRLALGAPRTRVFGMVVGEAGLIAVVGIAVGTPLTFAAARLLSSFLFEVKTTDVLAYSLSPLLLAAVALAAACAPARRASRVDPAVALRYE
jgi:putative ABC transport system permease protein